MSEESTRLKDRFNEILDRLERYSEHYDKGNYTEAVALSSLVNNLIGDRPGRKGSSLTTKLGCKPEKMVDLSYKSLLARLTDTFGPMCGMGFPLWGTKGLAPILDGPGPNPWELKETLFNDWWERNIIIRDSLGQTFTRRKIVETIRDKEDAHVDKLLEKSYEDLAYGGSLGINQKDYTAYNLDENPAFVALRQIAHEVLRTFKPDMKPKFSDTRGTLIAPHVIVELYRLTGFSRKSKKITTKSFEANRVVKQSKEPTDSTYKEASHPSGADGLAFSIMQKFDEEIIPRISIGNLNNIEIPNLTAQWRRIGAEPRQSGPVSFVVRIRHSGSGDADPEFVSETVRTYSRIPNASLEVETSISNVANKLHKPK